MLFSKIRFKVAAVLFMFSGLSAIAQNEYYGEDNRIHFGFSLGLNSMDFGITPSLVQTNDGKIYQVDVSRLKPGFSVGIIGDMQLSRYFNLRFTPTIHFGDKKFVFRRPEMEGVEGTDENPVVSMYSTSVRSNYLTFPLDVKYSAFRVNNYRPYLIGGIYGAFDLGRKKGNPILLKGTDFGVEFGIGCDIYLPFFKLCPELKFSFGLVDLLEKDRSDLTDPELIKYPNSLSKATSRMVTLTFNFE